MRLSRRSKKERRSESGGVSPVIDMAKRNLDPDDKLFFDGADLRVLLEKTDERPPISPAPVPESFFRRLSKKNSRKAPASPAAPQYPHTHLFRHVRQDDKLINWGADPITGVRYENPPRYLDPTPTESVRFVVTPSLAPYVKKLPGGKGPVESRRYCAARPPDQVPVETPRTQRVEALASPHFRMSVEPSRPRVEAFALARVSRLTGRISYLRTLPAKKSPPDLPIRENPKRKNGNPPPPLHPPTSPPPPPPLSLPPTSPPTGPSISDWLEMVEDSRPTTVDLLPTKSPRRRSLRRNSRHSHTHPGDVEPPNFRERKKDPRPTAVDPVKVATESPISPAKVATESPKIPFGKTEERKSLVRFSLRVLMTITHHMLLTFNQFLPAWRILWNSKVARDEFMNAWWTVWLAMVYFVALWGFFTTVGRFVWFLAEGINWALGVVSLVLVLSIFSSCCLANG